MGRRVTQPQLNDPTWLVMQRRDARKSVNAIAEDVGCSPGAVYYAFRRFGIDAWTGRQGVLCPLCQGSGRVYGDRNDGGVSA